MGCRHHDENSDDVATVAALAARAGDAAAARTLVVATREQVWRLLVHLSDPGSADDLTQETYERAFAALPRFRGESSARTWLLAIARRVAADHLRRRRSRPHVVAPATEDVLGAVAATPGDHAERVTLDMVLATLDPARHEAFVLTQVLGLDYREAAEVAGCPVGTIRSRVARARADLVAALAAGDGQRGAGHRDGLRRDPRDGAVADGQAG